MKTHKIFFILILAIVLRFLFIGTMPALNPDEAALGYNAYSLLKTGKDEHGSSWPIHFKSFGDYKPGGYVYLALPFIKILGLTPLATRLPNLILSILTIYYFYLLINQLSKNDNLAALSALILTISPWYLHFSRGAWEAGAALAFTVIGTYCFFKNQKYLFILFFSLSLYTYHSARLITPLLAIFLIILNYKIEIRNWKKWLLPIVFGIIICLPVLFSFLHQGGASRLNGVGLAADKGPLNRAEELLNQHGNTKIFNRIIHNKRVLYLLSWGQKYASHFNPNFLFINGDEVPRSKVPEMGLLYLIELPLLIYGFYQSKKRNQLNLLMFSWLLIAPIASSLTFQAPSALRSLPMVVPLSYFIAVGIINTQKVYPPEGGRAIYCLLIAIYLFSFAYYLDAYYRHYQKRWPFAWNYGFAQIVPYVESQKNQYDHIFFTNKFDQPYILYLFFSQYPPAQLQPQIKLTPPDQYGFSTVDQIDNITFHIPPEKDIPPHSLVISDKMLLP